MKFLLGLVVTGGFLTAFAVSGNTTPTPTGPPLPAIVQGPVNAMTAAIMTPLNDELSYFSTWMNTQLQQSQAQGQAYAGQ